MEAQYRSCDNQNVEDLMTLELKRQKVQKLCIGQELDSAFRQQKDDQMHVTWS